MTASVPLYSEPYYGPPDAKIYPAEILHPPQTVVITHVQLVNEPDYLAYSIFTTLCCCLPLGAAAFICSLKTRNANRVGNIVAARKYSRLALIFAHTALAVGLMIIILGNILGLMFGFTTLFHF